MANESGLSSVGKNHYFLFLYLEYLYNFYEIQIS